ncbi:hypothetical protein K1719_046464 [Acacia pycnantha]|nr:hypothetical protein K1719_046464 [Acacia pycnantha]
MSPRWTHRRRSSVRPSVFPVNAEPSRFLKIILPGDIHAQNMGIPKEFVRRFENELFTSEATIGVPDGRVWKMELKKSENEVLFCKSWEEFVKYYSLRFGFFLVFTYEGNSQFNVVIFDPSAAEIYYPLKVNPEKQNSAPKRRNKRPSSFDQCGYNTRSQRRNLVEDEQEIIDIEDDNALSHGKSGNKDRAGREISDSRKNENGKDRSGQGHCSKMMNRALSKRRQRAMQATQNSESKNPLSFTAIISSTNLNRYYIDVPASFWKVYLYKNYPMKLQDFDGRKWKVNYVKRTSRLRIRMGWISFARANNLKEGDVCDFELIKRNNNFGISKEFVRRFENELFTSEATIGVPDGRVWKMELKKSENEVLFCESWEEFVKYYSLRFGFFLVFTYEGNSQFNVVIFDPSAAEIYYLLKVYP